MPGHTFFPDLSKLITCAAAPLVLTPFVRNPKDLEFARLQSRMKSQVEEKVTTDQRRVMLMEQMRQITKELGIEGDEKQSLVQQFRDVVKDKTLPEEALKVLEAELTKLGTLLLLLLLLLVVAAAAAVAVALLLVLLVLLVSLLLAGRLL